MQRELLTNLRQIADRLTRRYTRKKIGRDPNDDEYAVAWYGLYEAVSDYDPARNPNFEAYAYRVIARRLIKLFRTEKKIKEYPEDLFKILSRMDTPEYDTSELKAEVIRFIKIMGTLNYTVKKIMDSRPRYDYVVKDLYQLAVKIVDSGAGELFIKDKISSRELNKLVGERVKIAKNQKPFLCAMIAVMVYDLPIMRNYLRITGKGVKK